MNSVASETAGSLDRLSLRASSLRDQGKGKTISFSPKVFIPLTRLCRDFCRYCTFRQSPQAAGSIYMTAEEMLDIARAGESAGCREALFVLGERPEERYTEARQWLHCRGYDSTLEYLRDMCALVLRETRLCPHSNPGTLSREELAALKPVNASIGLMLESTAPRLCGPGGPHAHAPSKRPELRLRTLEAAGQLKVAFTTGLLVGIGETAEERTQALIAIRDLQQQYGHIQEVIIQNFRAKQGTPMATAPEISTSEMLRTVAAARIILGAHMNIQVPPNLLSDFGGALYSAFLHAGINDWGGISPLTPDYVNPEAAWPHVGRMRDAMRTEGFQLRARFPVYPEYILERQEYLPAGLVDRLHGEMDPQGYMSDEIESVLFAGEPGTVGAGKTGGGRDASRN